MVNPQYAGWVLRPPGAGRKLARHPGRSWQPKRPARGASSVAVARPAGWARYVWTGRHPRDGLSEGRPAADERPAMAHLTLRSPWLLAAAAITPLAAGLVALPSTSVAATTAAGAPGTSSHFDLARKDCLGTARNSGSKVWFTVAGGVLSDTYYPTVDNTNVET